MKSVLLILLIGVMLVSVSNMTSPAFAAVTGSTNFCNQFPTYPECTGWRVEPISDNFWFCEYVSLPSMCNNPPDPKKEISPITDSYCCGIIGSFVPRDISLDNASFSFNAKQGQSSDILSQKELVIWTGKDHYDFGERVNVYGKFNFDDPILKNNNQFVDISINDRKVVLDLPVHSNGWFAGYFTLSNPYLFYTGNNLITVSYFHFPNQQESDKLTQASYIISTGDVPTDPFSIVDTSIPGKLSYEIISESNNSLSLDLAIVRLVTPDGLVVALPNKNSVDDVSKYLDISLISGQYEIVVTKGSHTSSQVFEYVE